MHIEGRGSKTKRAYPAFTLAEVVVVLLMISLLILMPQINLLGLFRRNSFRARMQKFISTMQMAAASAAESDRKYEVIIDLAQQSYMLREITNPDLSVVLEEEIILENDFGGNCRVLEVLFDDGVYTNQDRAKFRAGRTGWQCGGRIVLVDEDGQVYSVVVNRLNRTVKLEPGQAELLTPRLKSEMPF